MVDIRERMNLHPIRKKRALELKQMRLDRHITQMELSALSGLTQATISRIETGEIGWNIDSELIYFETLNNLVLKAS